MNVDFILFYKYKVWNIYLYIYGLDFCYYIYSSNLRTNIFIWNPDWCSKEISRGISPV